MKPLRIAMVLSYDPSTAGGVQVHLAELSRALEKRGHSVTVFGPNKKPKFSYTKYRPIGQLVRAPSLYGNWSNLMVPIPGHDEFSSIINSKRFDICHVHDVTVPSVAWGILNQVTIPKIVTFHSTWDDESWLNVFSVVLRMLKPQFSQQVQGVINVSRATEKKWTAIHDRHVLSRIIHNGVPVGIGPSPEKRDPRHVTILFLSRLVRNKGLMSLLKAFDRIARHNPQARIVVVGTGQERETAMYYLADKKWRRRVRFTGELIGKEKIDVLQSADIFAAPYVDEAFGITVLEAMATGLPVAGFRNGTFAQLFRQYPRKDMFVRRGDVDALSRSLDVLLSSAELRGTLGNWCLKESGIYSWETAARETESLYRAVLEKRKL